MEVDSSLGLVALRGRSKGGQVGALTALATRKNKDVRGALAGNPITPLGFFTTLATDEEVMVRQ